MANSELAKTDKGFPWHGIEIRGRRFGVERSVIEAHGQKYLTRWIVYLGGYTLRLHKFWRGDDDRAPHDHPFDFWTFPLRTYSEAIPEGSVLMVRRVKAFRWHFRAATFQHIVIGADNKKPFYTLCVSRYVGRRWGFWPSPTTFVYWRDWK